MFDLKLLNIIPLFLINKFRNYKCELYYKHASGMLFIKNYINRRTVKCRYLILQLSFFHM